MSIVDDPVVDETDSHAGSEDAGLVTSPLSSLVTVSTALHAVEDVFGLARAAVITIGTP
jgi:hypothetical protein